MFVSVNMRIIKVFITLRSSRTGTKIVNWLFNSLLEFEITQLHSFWELANDWGASELESFVTFVKLQFYSEIKTPLKL